LGPAAENVESPPTTASAARVASHRFLSAGRGGCRSQPRPAPPSSRPEPTWFHALARPHCCGIHGRANRQEVLNRGNRERELSWGPEALLGGEGCERSHRREGTTTHRDYAPLTMTA